MNKDDNRRQHDRFSADDVRGNFSYSVEARVLNISLGGLAVRTQSQLSIGRKYRFRLGGFSDALSLTGSVRWCRMSGTERQETGDIVPVYDAGIAFDEVLTDKAEELLRFMEKNIVLSPKRRISGRFKIESVDEVVLESESEFDVREISVSGMMIEADVALKPDTALELEMRLGRWKFVSPARIIYMSEIDIQEGNLRYRMGVEFLDASPDQKKKLEKFIRTELKKAGEVEQDSTEEKE